MQYIQYIFFIDTEIIQTVIIITEAVFYTPSSFENIKNATKQTFHRLTYIGNKMSLSETTSYMFFY